MANSQIWFCFGTMAFLLVSTFASEDVVVLIEENFEKEVGQERGALVKFYAPWCGHCKKLAPEYEWLGTSFKRDKSVLIGKVDCDDSKSLCTKYGVSSYPTIKWFLKGSLEPITYEGARTAEALTGFVNWKGGTKVKFVPIPSYVVVLTDENFNEIVFDHAKHVLVEFYSPRCGHCKKLAPDYEKLATAYKMEEDVVIAKLDAEKHKDLADRYDISGYPTLKFFPKHNKDGEDYDGELDLEDFILFINEHCGTRRDPNGKLTSDAGIVESLHLLVKDFVSGSIDEKKEILSQIQEEAEDLEGPAERYAEIYIKVAKSCIKKGSDYARKEIDRLHSVLESSISDAKADELTLKRNILSTFVM